MNETKRSGRLAALLLTVVIAGASVLPATAASRSPHIPYTTYDYSTQGSSVAAPVGYTPEERYTAASWGLDTPLSAPADLFFDNRDTLYLLDSGNSRILAFDQSMQLKEVYDSFIDADGMPLSFTGAQGLTVDAQGNFYIADTENGRLLLVDRATKTVRLTITRPDSALLSSDLPFDVTKVLLDNKGRIYALAKSVNLGAFVFTPEGEFLSFFGSNTVTRTGEALFNFILRRFMTKEQLSKMKQSTPISITNFDVDDRGFIYTATQVSGTTTAQAGWIRKLNYSGDDILSSDSSVIFGDVEWDRQDSTVSRSTQFIDLDVDADGFLNLLDGGNGKVFQYTEDGVLIAVFGAYGEQYGTFTNPSAVESIGSTVYVADAGGNCLYRFDPTAYTENFRTAVLAQQNNELDRSLEAWNQVLQVNTNNTTAYDGVGRIYDARGEYRAAMDNFRLAGDRSAYSSAFREYRKLQIKSLFLPLLGCAVLLIAGTVWLVRRLRRRLAAASGPGGTAFSRLESKYAFPLYTLAHPVDGFSQFKTRRIQSYRVAGILLVVWFVIQTVEFFCRGYIFNTNSPLDYNVFITLFSTAGLFILFVVSNWAICTLFNGSGSFKEIVSVAAYSLVPMLIGSLINLALTNILTQEESVFIGLISSVCMLWSLILLLCGLQNIHEYSFSATVFSLIVTVIGMVVIAFIAVMFFTLLQQTVNFFRSIFSEVALK